MDNEFRLLRLERQMQDLQNELSSARRSLLPQIAPTRSRPARISALPVSSGQKKFGVTFLQGQFANDDSIETVDFLDRSSAYAYNLGTQDPTLGEKVLCDEIGGNWWFKQATGEGSSNNTFISPTQYFQKPRYWEYYTVGHPEETEEGGLIFRTQVNQSAYYVSFDDSRGIAIPGLTQLNSSSPTNFRITESMVLVLQVYIHTIKVKYDTPTSPDPPVNFGFSIQADSPDEYFRQNGFRNVKYALRHTYSTDIDGENFTSVNSRGEPVRFTYDNFAGMGMLPLKFEVPAGTAKGFSLYIEKEEPGSGEANDYGFWIGDFVASLTRIE